MFFSVFACTFDICIKLLLTYLLTAYVPIHYRHVIEITTIFSPIPVEIAIDSVCYVHNFVHMPQRVRYLTL